MNTGPVKTKIYENMSYEKEEIEKLYGLMADASDLKTVASSEEVANLAIFLASEIARSITGVSYMIDNGALVISLFWLRR